MRNQFRRFLNYLDYRFPIPHTVIKSDYDKLVQDITQAKLAANAASLALNNACLTLESKIAALETKLFTTIKILEDVRTKTEANMILSGMIKSDASLPKAYTGAD